MKLKKRLKNRTKEAMKPIISILIFFFFAFCFPAPQKPKCKNTVAVEFYFKGSLVRTYHSRSYIAWQMHPNRKFDLDNNPFESDSVSVKIISDTLLAY